MATTEPLTQHAVGALERQPARGGSIIEPVTVAVWNTDVVTFRSLERLSLADGVVAPVAYGPREPEPLQLRPRVRRESGMGRFSMAMNPDVPD